MLVSFAENGAVKMLQGHLSVCRGVKEGGCGGFVSGELRASVLEL